MTVYHRIALIVLLGVLAMLPFLVSTTWQGILTKALIAALFATGFNLLLGQAGLLSFGHAAFYGIGAMATLHVMIAIERSVLYIPLPLLPLVGAAAGVLLAFISGCFATKRSGTYFALVTLAMAELIHVVAPMWDAVFGGEAGLTSMRMPSFGFRFDKAIEVYFLVLGWTTLGIALLWYLSKTAFGQLTLALNGNEQRLSFLGFDTYRTKVLTFSLSGMIAGLAGGLLAITNETANYTLFSVGTSTQVIFHTFIGGPAFFFGPAMAAAALTAIPFRVSNFTHAWPLYQGLLFMLIMLTTPAGLGGLIKQELSGVWDRARLVRRMSVAILIAGCGALVVAVVEWAGTLRHGGPLPQSVSIAVAWSVAAALIVMLGVLGFRWRARRSRRTPTLAREPTSSAPGQPIP